MIQVRYKTGYSYYFEAGRPGTMAAQISALEAEVAPGRWETVRVFSPDPLNPAFSMGRSWVAPTNSAAEEVKEDNCLEFKKALEEGVKRVEDDLRGRYDSISLKEKDLTDDLTAQLKAAQEKVAALEGEILQLKSDK